MPDGHPVASVIDGQQGVVAFCGRHHAVRVLHAGRQWLFAENPLGTGFGRGYHQVGVPVVAGGHRNDVELGFFQHLPIIGVHLQRGTSLLELRGKFVALLRHEIASGHDLSVFQLRGPLGVPLANAPAANNSYSVHSISFKP